MNNAVIATQKEWGVIKGDAVFDKEYGRTFLYADDRILEITKAFSHSKNKFESITLTAKIVYSHLKTMSRKAGYAFTTQKGIAKKLGISRNAVTTALKALLDYGWVKKFSSGGLGSKDHFKVFEPQSNEFKVGTQMGSFNGSNNHTKVINGVAVEEEDKPEAKKEEPDMVDEDLEDDFDYLFDVEPPTTASVKEVTHFPKPDHYEEEEFIPF